MPTYDYRCPACGRTWSDRRPVEDRDDMYCRFCDTGPRAERWPPAAPGIALKGPGFYATDYRDKKDES